MTTPALNPTPSQRQQWEAHKARQARLWRARPANTNIKTKPVVEVKQIAPTPFTPPRLVARPKRIPQNMWEKARITFNQHVIDYRFYLLDQERLASGYAEPEKTSRGQKPVIGIRDRKPIIDIVLEVLDQFPGVTVAELRGQNRTRRVVRPRQMAMYQLHKQRPDLSFPEIGRWFGGRDHTTALHSVRKTEADLAAGRITFNQQAAE